MKTGAGQPNYGRIVVSLLAAFVGIRSRQEMRADIEQLEIHGFRLFIIAGFGLAIGLHLCVYLIVLFVLPEGSSWALFGGRALAE